MGLFGKSKKDAPAAPAAPAQSQKPPPSLEDTVFNMKQTARQLNRMAEKSNKEIDKEKKKCKEAIAKENVEGARIHAENAVRMEAQGLNYLRLASRIDAVASRLDAQVKMQQIMGDMTEVTNALGEALGSMDVERIARTMDTFEQQLSSSEVSDKTMNDAFNQTSGMATPHDRVDEMLNMVGAQYELEVGRFTLGQGVEGLPVKTNDDMNPNSAESLEARLNELSRK